jgi:hypothetical protein
MSNAPTPRRIAASVPATPPLLRTNPVQKTASTPSAPVRPAQPHAHAESELGLKLDLPWKVDQPDASGAIIPPAPTLQLPPERFKTGEPWNEQRIRALAMYCSDGRWGDAFDDFCHRSLLIPRYDRFAVPGGPAWLTVSHDAKHVAQATARDEKAMDSVLSRAAWEQLGLLVRVHELQRIVLVGHYGCAFYMERLKRDADGCLNTQLQDLRHARDAVRTRFPRLTVETYLAMRQGTKLSFHGTV